MSRGGFYSSDNGSARRREALRALPGSSASDRSAGTGQPAEVRRHRVQCTGRELMDKVQLRGSAGAPRCGDGGKLGVMNFHRGVVTARRRHGRPVCPPVSPSC